MRPLTSPLADTGVGVGLAEGDASLLVCDAHPASRMRQTIAGPTISPTRGVTEELGRLRRFAGELSSVTGVCIAGIYGSPHRSLLAHDTPEGMGSGTGRS